MARVSDEKLATLEAPYLLGDIGTTFDVILDLRDARALLKEAVEQMERLGEVMDPQSYVQTVTAFNTADVLRRIRQHLEGHDD